MRSKLARTALMAAVAVLVLVGTACTPIGKIQTTTIKVEVSSERLLHLAIIPRVLPDGSPVDAVKADLLENVAARVGGYTLVENVMGAWVPPDSKDIVSEKNDLLMVAGPPELALYLQARLRKDFGQVEPFVIVLPIQSIAVMQIPPPRAQVQSETTESGGPTVKAGWQGID